MERWEPSKSPLYFTVLRDQYPSLTAVPTQIALLDSEGARRLTRCRVAAESQCTSAYLPTSD